MMTQNEQIQALHQKRLQAGMKLMQLSLDNSQRLLALQVEVSRKIFQDGVENARALGAARDAQQAVAIHSRYMQDTAQSLLECMRQIADLGNDSRVELSHLMSEHLAGDGRNWLASFQNLATQVPGQNMPLIESLSQAMNSLNDAIEQFAKASTTTFNVERETPASKSKPAPRRRQGTS